jgi:hypothetical protein
MTEEDWKVLLPRIRDGKCTPFLGAGVNHGLLPLGGQIAREWASDEHYPLTSQDDLASVAQFIAVLSDSMEPKERILRRLRREPRPNFAGPDERLDCLRALAELPLPIYLTTNYDDLMVEALRHTEAKKEPRREICRWHNRLKLIPPVIGGSSKYTPTCASPLVYHLHGSDEFVQSLVLTEDDYLDFLVNISRNRKLLPPRIEEALTDASLLFIGYRLRVIHRGLVQSMDGSLRRLSVTVQMTPPDDSREDPAAAEKYMTSYFEDLNVRVYWGSSAQFAKELRDRWRTFRNAFPDAN